MTSDGSKIISGTFKSTQVATNISQTINTVRARFKSILSSTSSSKLCLSK